MAQKGSQDRGGERGDEAGSADEQNPTAQQHVEAHEEPPPIFNDANEVDEQLQVFPSPGCTESGQPVQQCSDQGGLYWPIVGLAMNTPLPQAPPLTFPLPGWTERGHRLVQCTDREDPPEPIAGAHEEPPPILNDANEVEEQLQVFPLPGWTESGQRVQQCSDQGGLYWPIVGLAMNTPLPQAPPLMFPLPGWTERGHRLVQCTDREDPPEPIAGNMAAIPTQRGPQEDDCDCVSCRNDHHG